MSPIQFALAEIRDTIPAKILEICFTPKTKYRLARQKFMSTTIEQQILDKVINGRVRRYVNSRGAQEITIPLNGLPRQDVGYQAWTMHIPKSLTKGRTITHAISVHVGMMGFTGGSTFGSITTFGMGVSTTNYNNSANAGMDVNTQGAKAIYEANKPIELNYTANVYLIDENTIYCEDRMAQSNLELRCKVASDEEFSFIQGAHVQVFAKLCRLATEAYIYNNLDVDLDEAYLEGGVDIGKIRERVDQYSDSDDEFIELAEGRWKKIQHMADKPRRLNYLNSLISRGT